MPFKIIEAPNKFSAGYYSRKAIFLAGGITDCPDWQQDAIQMLITRSKNVSSDYLILNPRRSIFDTTNENEAIQQIKWEYRAISKSRFVLFWFPDTSLCPITLLELGKELMRSGRYRRNGWNLHIGCHPNYKRFLDVKIQTELAKGSMFPIHTTLSDTVNSLIKALS